MDVKELKQLINKGENSFVEFSRCTTELTDSVFQSICSYLNKDGGIILVGVHDFGRIVGVAEIFIENMLKKFVYSMEHEFSPAVSLEPEVIAVNEQKVIYINVASSTEVHRYKNKVYDRVDREVSDITYNYNLVENLYLRKQNESSENIVCPFLRMTDLDEMAFRSMRKAIAIAHPNGHPWLELTNEEMLHSAGFWSKDMIISKKEGFVLAAVLLFGKEVTIQNYSPITYRTDAIYRNVSYERFTQPLSDYPESRYDDRDIIFSNLIDSYARLQKFVQRNLPRRVLNKGNLSVNVRDKVFTEMITNFLVHREYTHKYPSRLLIFSDRVITENGSNPLHNLANTLNELEVEVKNPLITNVFKEMGWIEEPGSGKKNILRYAPFYDKTYEVEIQNGEKFVFSISYGNEGLDAQMFLPSQRMASNQPSSTKAPIEWPMYASRLSKACPAIDTSYVDKAESILEACVKPLPIQDMMRIVKQSNRTRFRQNIIRPLIEEGLLGMRIPAKPSSPLQTYFTTEKGKALFSLEPV
jgi:ATP-dependent DNA helicase RecG